MERRARKVGARLEAVIWSARVLLAVGEMLLARVFPWVLGAALAADLAVVSPLLLERQRWHLSLVRPADGATRVYAPPTALFSTRECLKSAFHHWQSAIAWRWGWWWRCAGAAAVCALPAVGIAALLPLIPAEGVLAVGVRLSLQAGTLCAGLFGGIVALGWMVGYYPAVYWAAQGTPAHAAFAASKKAMRRRSGRFLGQVAHQWWRFLCGPIPFLGWYWLTFAYQSLARYAVNRLFPSRGCNLAADLV